jgi:hypothetical protein
LGAQAIPKLSDTCEVAVKNRKLNTKFSSLFKRHILEDGAYCPMIPSYKRHIILELDIYLHCGAT